MSYLHAIRTRNARWLSVPAALAFLGGLALFSYSSEAVAEESAEESAAVARLQDLSVQSNVLASGLNSPTSIAAPDDGSDRLLITERPGTVRVYHPDSGLSPQPLLDISDRVEDGFLEQGLLGIATPPDFAENPVLYVVYAANNATQDVTLSRFELNSPDQTPIDPSTEEILVAQDHSVSPSHYGGQLAFGPDGYLYWSIGDGGFPADPLLAGQDRGTLLGKILRLDVSGECDGQPYCVPQDNPFVGDPDARPEIWSYGLRNPWRFSFDRADGSLWIGDVGQGTIEEVNHVGAGEGGHNFGWSCLEGLEVFNQDQCFPDETLTDPVFHYPHQDGLCSVTGGYVYRGQQYASIAGGVYVATDWCTGDTWGIVPQAGEYAVAEIGTLPFQIHSLGEDVDGELYAVTGLPGQLHAVSFS